MPTASLQEELSRSELEAAEFGFAQLLRRKRLSQHFIERNCSDLLARARFEYSRHLAEGDEIHNPVGWLIHCAWRRAQNALEAERRTPQHFSIEEGAWFADDATPTPEEEVLEDDRRRRIQEAVDRLPLDERKVIELTYFEGLSVREVGRVLAWDKSKAARRHRAALDRLRQLLGIEDPDALAIEIGLAAWLSIATQQGSGIQLPAGFEAAADTTSRGIGNLIARAHELARRVISGGAAEPGMGAAASGVARTAGVCGAAALACVASGVVGPGVGGIGLLGAHANKAAHNRPIARARSTLPVDAATSSPVAISEGSAESGTTTASASSGAGIHKAVKSTATTFNSGRQTEEEFTPFATSASSTKASRSSGASEGPAPSGSAAHPSSTEGQTSPEFEPFR